MEPQISIEITSEIKRSIQMTIPRALYDSRFDDILTRTTAGVRLKGFRPGRAPRAMVAKMYQEKIHQDVLSKIVGEAYEETVKKHSLRVVGSPNINVKDPEPDATEFKVTAEVDLFPEPIIKDYFGLALEIELQADEPAEEEVQKAIDEIRNRYASLEAITDRTVAQAGDVLTIDYDGTVDGQRFNDSVGTDVVIELGDSEIPQELTAGLVGIAVGELRELDVVLPERSGELAGKTAHYHITAKGISTKVLPELDDELAKRSELAQTVAELHEVIANNICTQRKEANDRVLRDKLFESLAEKNEFEVPQILVDEEIREILFELGALNRRERKSYDMDLSGFRKPLEKGAEFRVRRFIMLEQIVKQEEFEASADDVNSWLDTRAADAKRPREEIEKAFGLPKNAEAVNRMVTRERMVEQLLEKSKVKKSVKAAASTEG